MGGFPEHDKVTAVHEKSQAIGEFLEWLTRKYTFCTWNDQAEEWVPRHFPINKLLAEYFGVDLSKLDAEKQAMLDSIRQERNKDGER